MYLFGSCPKNHGTSALLHKEGVLCIICTVGRSGAIKWVTSSSRNVCTATACSQSAQPSALWHHEILLAFLATLCFVLCSQGLLGNVDDSFGGVPLGTAFLPPLPTPCFVFFSFHQNVTF